MKARLMALLLAAGLGVTGVAMTAQAAEAGTKAVNGCAHSEMVKFTSVKEAINLGDGRHFVEYEMTYICINCEQVVKKEGEAKYESHEYEQIYFDNGKVMSYCIICDEKCFW